jgi:hypothetical protein
MMSVVIAAKYTKKVALADNPKAVTGNAIDNISLRPVKAWTIQNLLLH